MSAPKKTGLLRGAFHRGMVGTWLVLLLGGGCSLMERPQATVATDEMPRELDKVSLPPYVVEPPDILVVESRRTLEGLPLSGEFLVRSDGTIALGGYGDLYVSGYTLEEVKNLVYERLNERVKQVYPEDIFVDIVSYNSKVYYVITDGGGAGEQVVRLPSTGNETVLDALAQIGGLSPVSSKQRVWIARPTPDGDNPQILPVDWRCIVENGATKTNYQIFPGDRIYLQADPLITLDTMIGKVTAPVERVLGNILLWDITVKRLEGGGGQSNQGGFGF